MQPSSPQNSSRTTIIAAVVILAGAAVYYFYYSGSTAVPSDSTDATLSADSPSSSAVGQDVLTLLSEIKSLNIDTTFFQTPAYESLVDFSVSIPSVGVGRSNPFSPLGNGNVSVPASTPSSVPASAPAAAPASVPPAGASDNTGTGTVSPDK